jgi:hypothetical protein
MSTGYWPRLYWLDQATPARGRGFWPRLFWPAPEAVTRDVGFARVASLEASTKRAPGLVSGKRGQPATYLESIQVTPLDPVDAETRERLALNTPHELLQTFVDGDWDIAEGDVLVVAGAEYPVRSAAQWDWRGSLYVHLVIEELKR